MKKGNNKPVKIIQDFWRHLSPNLRIILLAFILLNLLALGIFLYFNRQNLIQTVKQGPVSDGKEQSQAQPKPAPSRPPKPQPPKDYDLKISDQFEGITITLDLLASPKKGWFVLYKDAGGVPGELLEEAIPPYEAGTYSGIVFFLRTPLVSGQKYFAILHTEDGDAEFNFPGPDKEALNSKGDKVMQSFIVK